jgi:hypothetical protein
MGMADKYTMNIDAGATYALTVTWTDSNDTPINLTGYTARMKLKSDFGGTALVSLTETDGLTLGGASGTIAISISPTLTGALCDTEPKKGVYDLELVSSGGVVTRLLEGRWIATPEVTD